MLCWQDKVDLERDGQEGSLWGQDQYCSSSFRVFAVEKGKHLTTWIC